MAAGDVTVTAWISKDDNTTIDSTLTALSFASGDALEHIEMGDNVKFVFVKGS